MHLAIGGKKKKLKNITPQIVLFKTGENIFALITTATLQEWSEILKIMKHHHFCRLCIPAQCVQHACTQASSYTRVCMKLYSIFCSFGQLEPQVLEARLNLTTKYLNTAELIIIYKIISVLTSF